MQNSARNLSHSSNIFRAIFRTKAQIAIQSEPDIIPIQIVTIDPTLQ